MEMELSLLENKLGNVVHVTEALLRTFRDESHDTSDVRQIETNKPLETFY
jgi:hypothetical protein